MFKGQAGTGYIRKPENHSSRERFRTMRRGCKQRPSNHAKLLRGYLRREPESNENEKVKPMAELLKPETVQVLLDEVPKWKLGDNNIERTFEFDGFQPAIEFVNRLAKEAEGMNHHPDIDIRWNKVKLVLSTHSAGGLTDLDFMLATKIDKLA
jgi:4a-hydroxytetrahydrobiopterin dehydratase